MQNNDNNFSEGVDSLWHKEVLSILNKRYKDDPGNSISIECINIFPADYQFKHSTQEASEDFVKLQALSPENSIIYNLVQKDQQLLLKLFSSVGKLSLSNIMPKIENLGFLVQEERYYNLNNQDHKCIHVYIIEPKNSKYDVFESKKLIEDALYAVQQNRTISDNLSKLITYEQLSWREIDLLRSLAAYTHQVCLTYDYIYISKTLIKYSDFVKKLIKLFCFKFCTISRDIKKYNELHEILNNDLAQISSSSEDKVLRSILGAIEAGLRTNFFQPDSNNDYKKYISIKFDSSKVPDIPSPIPYAEIFVYSKECEGIHLRGGKVSRGGIRWSDRVEDYRTEALGLMKAQMTKNAVIVPEGSKGAFCTRINKAGLSRDEYITQVISAYQNFLRGLLDVTDNIISNSTVSPQNTEIHDQHDPYLVVAADKGTASFSDYANQVSREYNFWLGDAFASGGSAGYDHKKMGITARGAWISVQRHFREMDIDTQADEITVVGIGDMSGDVFGNGMLMSDTIKLVAAFNHIHIFIDPEPDPRISFQERKRLFDLPGSKWSDYDRSIISEGGGVYERTAKSISLSSKAMHLLQISKKEVSPNELIKAILKAKVHLIWNGGIGTYIKAASEENYTIGDKTNDMVRVNGAELQSSVIGEGGNLGVSQKGRIEYAMNGGRVNTDFIDNSAGVDCSDHEVNIKIALGKAIEKGLLDTNERNKILEEMTDQVTDLVLEDNINQTLAITMMAQSPLFNIEVLSILIDNLEKTASLNREIEFIPTTSELIARSNIGAKLTRPELSVILSYSKRSVYNDLEGSNIAHQEYFTKWLVEYFPKSIQKRFAAEILDHPLKKQIILTMITNKLVNRLSAPVINSLKIETGCKICDIVRGFVIVQEIFDFESLWKSIDNLPCSVKLSTTIEIYTDINKAIRRGIAWMVTNMRSSTLDIDDSIIKYKENALQISEMLTKNLQGPAQDKFQSKVTKYVEGGLKQDLAEKSASLDTLVSSFDIASMSIETGEDLEMICRGYFVIADLFHFDFLRKLSDKLMSDSYWQRLSLQSIKDDLYYKQRRILGLIVKDGILHDVNTWYTNNLKFSSSYNAFIENLKMQENIDISMLILANKKLEIFIRKQ